MQVYRDGFRVTFLTTVVEKIRQGNDKGSTCILTLSMIIESDEDMSLNQKRTDFGGRIRTKT